MKSKDFKQQRWQLVFWKLYLVSATADDEEATTFLYGN